MKIGSMLALVAAAVGCFGAAAGAQAQSRMVPVVGLEEKAAPTKPSAALKSLTDKGGSLLVGDFFEKILATSSELHAVDGVTCPTTKAGLTDGWSIFTYSLDRNASAELNLYAKAEIAASDRVVLYHFMFYKDMYEGADLIGHCGSGVSLALKISNFKAEMSLDLPVLAANGQLGNNAISYKVGTFGISGKPIDEAAPAATAIGKFDTQSYAALMGAIDKVQAAGTEGTGVTFTPKLVDVAQPGDDETTPRSVLIRTLVLGAIAKGTKCKDARALVPSRTPASDATVDQFYKSLTKASACSTFDNGPSSANRAAATADLATFKIVVN